MGLVLISTTRALQSSQEWKHIKAEILEIQLEHLYKQEAKA